MSGDVAGLLAQARTGDNAVLGELLQSYHNYLRLLARIEIGRRLQGKIDASDIVQETFLDAHRHFPGFRGEVEAQFVQWLRAILAGTLANVVRRYLERVLKVSCHLPMKQIASDTLQHQVCHGDPNMSLTAGSQRFVVFAVSLVSPSHTHSVTDIRCIKRYAMLISHCWND